MGGRIYGFGARDVERIARTVRAAEGAIPRLMEGANHRSAGGRRIVFGVLTTGASGASGMAGFTPAQIGADGELTTGEAEEFAVLVPRLQ